MPATTTPKATPRAIEPVGVPEIAERLDWPRRTVEQWRYRGQMPEPKWTVGGGPAWNWPDIYRWARETGRLT